MHDAATARIPRSEAWAAPLYFAAYLAYLFWRPESELLHWLTLVGLPVALVAALRRWDTGSRHPVLPTFGLRRGNLTCGVGWAVLLGLAVSLFQVVGSRYADPIVELVRSGRVLSLFPLAFAAMAVTAGFTEEFFFRGFLQTRLERLLQSRFGAVVAGALLFGVYHLPYAYLNPSWPSAGDWPAAVVSALGQGGIGGLLLGGVYALTRHNLVACIVLHSAINTLPAMTMIRFSGG